MRSRPSDPVLDKTPVSFVCINLILFDRKKLVSPLRYVISCESRGGAK